MLSAIIKKGPDGVPGDMLIRPLTVDDQPFLWDAIYHAVYVPPGKAPPPRAIVNDPELARYVAGWMQRPDDLGFVAEKKGVPIGAAWLRRWSGDERGYGFVDEATPELAMSMLPGHRGQGIGTKLLRRVLSAAEERFAAVSLGVFESNPARRLYEREGFVRVGDQRGDSLVMVRRFSP